MYICTIKYHNTLEQPAQNKKSKTNTHPNQTKNKIQKTKNKTKHKKQNKTNKTQTIK